MALDGAAVLAAFGGGCVGAAVGALPAFIFTGLLVLAGVAITAAGGGPDFLAQVAFGPVFGPHTAFAGGAAATAYAARRGKLENGRDITVGLMGLDAPDVLLVGGGFGIFGYLLNALCLGSGLGPWTDTIALSVFLSGVTARLVFGSTGLFGKVAPDGRRFRPDLHANWLPFQQRFPQVVVIGAGFGLVSAFTGLALGPGRGGEAAGFGIAAALILFLQMGRKTPVMHHIALPAASAAILTGSVLAGAVAGVVGGLLGELLARAFLIHGDTHVDPPAGAIAAAITLVRLLQLSLESETVAAYMKALMIWA